MFLSELIQRIVHLFDVGAGSRVLRIVMVGLMAFALGLWYDLRDFQNFSTPEAMDSAQLARNIAEGRGYTTDFVRPLSVFLVSQRSESQSAGKAVGVDADFARIQTRHPDLANPPVYPVFLAGLMKVLPFQSAVQFQKRFWSEDGRFARYQPDFLIGVINQLLLLVVAWQTFLIARKLFDAEVAWVSAILVMGCEMFWRFSLSGLPTLLVTVVFLGLTRLLIKFEETAQIPEPPVKKVMGAALLAGLLAGLGALTCYSFGWLILPIVLFIALFGGPMRWRAGLFAVGGFLLLLAPWVLRNYLVSGTPFGTAGFAVAEGTFAYPNCQLEQSLHPDLTQARHLPLYFHKLCLNLWDILQNDLPRLGLSWVTMLFFAGLLTGFRGALRRRMRWFLLMSLAVLAVVQSLVRTSGSDPSPEVNSENLLVFTLPLVMIYGAAFFFTCLDQFEWPLQLPLPPLRVSAMTGFAAVMCLPLLGALFSSKASPVVYPPYYPPDIQKCAGWMRENEMMMSDVPWAVAWYGHRQCLWLTLNDQDDFYAVNDGVKEVRGLYLTPETMNVKFLDECVRAPEDSWGRFVLKTVIGGEPPSRFSLRTSAGSTNIVSGVCLTDRARWLPLLH